MGRDHDSGGHHRPHHQARAVWFVHGLGDWSDVWRQAFYHPALADWELYATDLPGMGWTLPLQTEATVEHFADWLQDVVSTIAGEKPVVLVGHSIGGAIATMLAKQMPGWLAGFVNVNGNLTEADCSLISALAANAIDFEQWFEAFSEHIYRDGLGRRVLRRYHAGLLLSHHPTFLTACRSLVQLSQNGSLRQIYSTLSIPRIHFHSTTEYSQASRQFLAEQSLDYVAFEGIGHWLMREAEQDFYQRLGDWLRNLEQERQ